MKNLTQHEFIKKATDIFGNLYNYDESVYINSKIKIKIFCNICKNYFMKTPNSHLSKKEGCNSIICKKTNLSNNIEFIKKANKIIKLKNKNIDLSLVEYIHSNKLVKFKCIDHDLIFEQTPSRFLSGYLCPMCGVESKKSDINDFITLSKLIHGETHYNYDNVIYNGTREKVEIICNIHNESFYQEPRNHTNGQGCRKCFEDNYSFSFLKRCEQNGIKNGILYFVNLFSKHEDFFKIGVTYSTNIKDRMKYIPYN